MLLQRTLLHSHSVPAEMLAPQIFEAEVVVGSIISSAHANGINSEVDSTHSFVYNGGKEREVRLSLLNPLYHFILDITNFYHTIITVLAEI